MHHRQTHARALTHFVGGEKGFEDAGDHHRLDTRAVIADLDREIFAVDILVTGCATGMNDVQLLGDDTDLAGVFYGTACIQHQVQQHLIKL